MTQEKIRCNARERKRVKEHSMKRGGGEEGGRWPLLEAPEEKGASLCRSIVPGFESAKKDEFVSYAVDELYTINGVTSQSL